MVSSVAYVAGVLLMIASVATVSLLRTSLPPAMTKLVSQQPAMTHQPQHTNNPLHATSANHSSELLTADDDVMFELDDLAALTDESSLGDWSQTTQTHTQLNGSMEADDNSLLTRDRTLTLPGLLTLTFVQETVSQFLSALRSDSTGVDDDDLMLTRDGSWTDDADDGNDYCSRCGNLRRPKRKWKDANTNDVKMSSDLPVSGNTCESYLRRQGHQRSNGRIESDHYRDELLMIDGTFEMASTCKGNRKCSSWTSGNRDMVAIPPSRMLRHVALDVPVHYHTTNLYSLYS